MARADAAWVLIGSLLLPLTAQAQATNVTNPCDPRLMPQAADPLAYGRRGERCEGLYLNEVAGTGGLSIVAFTSVSRPFAIKAGEPIRLEWSAPPASAVALRAVSLRPDMYYRMDSSRPAGSTSFDWPSDVVTRLKLKSDELGLVAWTPSKLADRSEDVYIPLRVAGPPLATDAPGEYVVVVVPGAPLRELFVSLSAVDESGKSLTELLSDAPLKHGPYPAEYPIPVRLPKLTTAGLYRLELNAVLKQGAPSPRTLYFRHNTK